MHSSDSTAPAHLPEDFAGLLAAFAEPQKKFPPARDTDGLADDIDTLSYEQALRTHSRYRPVDGSPGTPAQRPVLHVTSSTRPAAPAPLPDGKDAVTTKRAPSAPAAIEPNLKRASITIRLSLSECEQLHQRAAEAGLTLSAYLRSCAFEVETLRAQVKETLVQLRSATLTRTDDKSTAPPRPFWSRLWSMVLLPLKGRNARP